MRQEIDATPTSVRGVAKRHALFVVAILPLLMLLSYIGLMIVDRRRANAPTPALRNP